jgi:chromosome segregation ATPase
VGAKDTREDRVESKLSVVQAVKEERDRAVGQLKDELKKLKASCLDTVADYKKRFDESRDVIEKITRESEELRATVQKLTKEHNDRVQDLNERLGREISKLRDRAEKAEARVEELVQAKNRQHQDFDNLAQRHHEMTDDRNTQRDRAKNAEAKVAELETTDTEEDSEGEVRSGCERSED